MTAGGKDDRRAEGSGVAAKGRDNGVGETERVGDARLLLERALVGGTVIFFEDRPRNLAPSELLLRLLLRLSLRLEAAHATHTT